MRTAATPPTWWLTTTAVAPTPSPIDPRPRIIPLNPLRAGRARGRRGGHGGVGTAGALVRGAAPIRGRRPGLLLRRLPGAGCPPQPRVDALVDLLADPLDQALGDGRVVPRSELGVGGHGRGDLVPLVDVHAHTLCRNGTAGQAGQRDEFSGARPAAR